jgi:DNA topoisomerase-1
MTAAYKAGGNSREPFDVDIMMDPEETIQATGLRYVSDAAPGIQRRRAGRGYVYRAPNGTRISDRATRERIKSLRIPPAWQDVWICSSPHGHIQATGRDERGRKQYIYHQDWNAARDETKFARLAAFGACLPRIRRRVMGALTQPGLPHDKVIAAVVELLDRTCIRIGNEAYTRANKSYGLTTMRHRHVEINGAQIQFEFRSKSGKHRRVELHDRRLARILLRCEELPGYELFQYLDECGEHRQIDAADVNRYLLQIAGEHFTAKDFRTWGGSVVAARTLRELGPAASTVEASRNITEAIKAAATELGNTPAVCRKAYVHPAILDAYKAGRWPLSADECAEPAPKLKGARWLHADERELLRLLRDEAAGSRNTSAPR